MEGDMAGNEETEQSTFRIPSVLRAELEEIAKEEDRSLSKQIISALRKHVEDRKAKATQN